MTVYLHILNTFNGCLHLGIIIIVRKQRARAPENRALNIRPRSPKTEAECWMCHSYTIIYTLMKSAICRIFEQCSFQCGKGPGAIFSYKLRYIVGFWLVEMAISTNQNPTIYRNLYENTAPVASTLIKLATMSVFDTDFFFGVKYQSI